MAGVFNRGRAGSGEVWHTPSNLARHADKVRVTPRRTPLARLPASSPLPSPPPSSAHIAPALPPQSSVPLRECLADAFAASARDEHENVDPMEDVDLDEIELVYDTLAKSERIVRGYTEFGFEDKGVRRAYRTSEPDAVEESDARPTVGRPYGNPLFRAEGILFESVGVGSGGRGGGGDVFDSVSRATRVAPASSRVRSPESALDGSFSWRGPGGVLSSTRPSSAPRSHSRSHPWSQLRSRDRSPRRPMFAGGRTRPASLMRELGTPRGGGARGDATRRADARPPTPAESALIEKIQTVLKEVRERMAGPGTGTGAGEEASPEANLGPRFNAASGDGDAIRRRRRKKVVDALARPAFDAWRELARGTEAERQAAMLRKAVGAFSRSTTAAALRRWAEFADERKQMRGLLERAAAKFRNATISGAFSRWVEFAEEASEMRELLSRAVSFFAKREMAGAFSRWVEFAEEASEMRGLLERAASRFRNAAISGAFSRWVEFAEEASEMRELLSRAVSFFAKREMAGAFSRWVEFAEEASEMRGLLERAASRFRNAAISGAFSRWVEFAEESGELKATLARGLRFWVNGALARCFERWIEALDAARVARKTMKWWAERALVSSWLRWKERVVDAHTLRWAAQFFVKRAMGAAFNRWIEHHEEAKDMRAMLAQAAARFRLSAAAAAWSRWIERVDDARVARRAASYFVRSSTRSAFNRWVEFAAEVSAFRETLARAVARFRDSTLASAWSRWLERARRGESRRAKDVVARAHARLLDARRAAETITRWREATLRAMLAREERALARDRFRVTATRRAWNLWTSRVRERFAEDDADEHRARRVARDAIHAWYLEMWVSHRRREARASRALRGWRRAATEATRRRALDDVARASARRRRLGVAFRGWSRAWLLEARAALAREVFAVNNARRAVRRWRWRARDERRRRVDERLADAHRRARTLARGFAGLSHHWARKVLLRAFVYGRQRRVADAAWTSWQYHLHDVRSMRAERDRRAKSFAKSSPERRAPWLVGGPGKKTRSPLGSEKWKFY